MQFTYKVPTSQSNYKLDFNDNFFLIGSCFSENIGLKLRNSKFNTYQNPHGITFNPLSISNTILDILDKKVYHKDDVFETSGLWLSWKHHSKIWGEDFKSFLEGINQINSQAYQKLINANVAIVTLGTSFYYTLKETGNVVNNCHKQPASLFEKELSSAQEIVFRFKEWIEKLLSINTDIKIIFTISPVRHLKEGAFENNVSKSTLFLAVNELLNRYPQTSYFPAYEIVMDELRDYRFYESDWVHPNQLATDYIWEKFSEVYFTKETHQIISKVDQIKNAAQHKILRFQTQETLNFLKSNIKLIEEIEKVYPFLKFDEEKNYFCSLIEKHSHNQ